MASSPSRSRPSPLRRLAEQVFVAALYFGAAELGFTAAVVAGSASPVWPGTAVTLVAVLRRGPVMIPAILVGTLAANATRPVPWYVVLGTALANTAEPFVTRAALRRLRIDTQLVSAADVAGFVVAVLCGATVSAAGGIGGLFASGILGAHAVPDTAALWIMGNVAGALCAAPLALVPKTRGHAGRTEEIVVVTLAAVVSAVVMSASDIQVYALFPVLIWAGLRLGPRGASAVAMVMSVVTVAAAARGIGPFLQGDATRTLLTCQGFIIVTTLTTLLLAAITEDRRRAGDALARSEDAKRALADEQAALRHIAEAAAREQDATPVLELATSELIRILDVDAAAVVEYLDDNRVRVWGESGVASEAHRVGKTITVERGGAVDRVRQGGTARQHVGAAQTAIAGLVQRVAVPVMIERRPWGAVVVGRRRHDPLPEATEALLARVADLVSLAVADARARAQLESRAATDPLTGLLNHRAFHERLREEVARARRYGRRLSVAVFDIDNFKAVNDAFGHARGDAVLAEATRRLVAASRADEPVGRLGGDELAVIMPETGGLAAHHAADRMRRAIGASEYPEVGALTASAGTCDLAEASSAEELLRLADGALYWAKGHGRDVCVRYTPEVVEELSAAERAERMARHQALSGVRALARAIDAKDPSTIRHSERVADLVALLAERAGWDAGRVALLREAGLVHDVGKIGVPDAVLFKRERLDDAEWAQVQRHAALGAQIASEVLLDEQAAWIRGHHERHDGGGYPDGLAGAAIPDGARLLAMADAWDAMTRARFYSPPMSQEDAWEETLRQSGRQFAPEAVAALGALIEDGLLPMLDEAVGARWS